MEPQKVHSCPSPSTCPSNSPYRIHSRRGLSPPAPPLLQLKSHIPVSVPSPFCRLHIQNGGGLQNPKSLPTHGVPGGLPAVSLCVLASALFLPQRDWQAQGSEEFHSRQLQPAPAAQLWRYSCRVEGGQEGRRRNSDTGSLLPGRKGARGVAV